MFCPKCQAEYRVGFTRCNDCEVELVDRIAENDRRPRHSKFVHVATVQGFVEEGQIQSFLEANGIPSFIEGEAVRKAYGIVFDGIGPSRIVVPEEYGDAARELLAKAEHGDFRIDENSTPRDSEA